MTDDNGCATDPSIFGEWQYERNLGVLTASFNAFKFPASNNIRFQCNIRVCFGQCQPQNCAGSNATGDPLVDKHRLTDGKWYYVTANRFLEQLESTDAATDDVQ